VYNHLNIIRTKKKELSLNILVRNLPKAVTERELALMFMKFGKVKSFNIVTDKKTGVSKGFGFVDMPEESEAHAAMKALDGKLTRGMKIRVKTSTKSGQTLKELRLEGDWKEHSHAREIKGKYKERSSTGRPDGRFTEKPTQKSSGRRNERSYERPASRTTERTPERSTGRPTRRFTGKATERPSERPVGRPNERSAGRPAERLTERSTGRPAGKRTGRPSEKSTQRSMDRHERSDKRSSKRPAGRPKR
jgi:RNA recognition motif-containing protein